MDPRIAASRARSARGLADAMMWREGETNRLRGGLYDAMVGAVPPQTARSLAGLLDFVPGLGDAAGFEDAYQDFSKGNYASGAVNALGSAVGVVPGIGDAAGAALGIFAGAMAKNANLPMMQRAQEMAQAGADQRAIWDETGWFQGADGKWRFEIDDSKAELSNWGKKSFIEHGETAGRQAGIFAHPELYAAYPDVGEINSRFSSDYQAGGSYERLENGRAQILASAPGSADMVPINLHELQHAVQEIEDFNVGGNPSQFYPEELINQIQEMDGIEDSLIGKSWREADPVKKEEIRRQAAEISAKKQQLRQAAAEWRMQQYRSLAGEAEARNVEARRTMTPEQRRATPPWETEDTPRDRQILRFR